ncbi:MAG: hypothetical protein AAF517_26425, partial [Planctomycetota bacterium]
MNSRQRQKRVIVGVAIVILASVVAYLSTLAPRGSSPAPTQGGGESGLASGDANEPHRYRDGEFVTESSASERPIGDLA